MSDLAIHIIAICGIISVAIGVASWIRVEKVERKVDSFQFRMKELEWKLSEAIDLTSKLQQQLWALQKPKVEIRVDMADTEKQLTNLAESLASIGKEQPFRRLKEELKPEDYYERLMEPIVLAAFPDQIGPSNRGSEGWLRDVMYSLMRLQKTATGSRRELLQEGINFCQMVLTGKEVDRV